MDFRETTIAGLAGAVGIGCKSVFDYLRGRGRDIESALQKQREDLIREQSEFRQSLRQEINALKTDLTSAWKRMHELEEKIVKLTVENAQLRIELHRSEARVAELERCREVLDRTGCQREGDGDGPEG